MYDNRSDYAINKADQDAIVYPDGDDQFIRLTRAQFVSEDEFLRWKAWSDDNYHDQENGNHLEKNNTMSMTGLPDRLFATDGPEVIIEQRFQKLEKEQQLKETVIYIRGRLTEKQFRRVWLYYSKDLTEKAVGKIENTSQGRISDCISPAILKIRRIFRIRQISPDIRRLFSAFK